jgi:prepilin-type processing-associated H-X9-DG protein
MKQISLGALMYANDCDDGLPLFANGNPLDLANFVPRVDTWVWTTQPYIKSLSLLIDPLMGDPNGVFTAGGAHNSYWYQNLYPDFGVNYVFLSPWQKDGTGACTLSGSVTASGGSHPSTTIFYTTTYTPNLDEYGNPIGGYSNFGSWIVTAPAMLSILQNSSTNCVRPGMDWSKNPGSFNSGNPFTAEASERYNNGGNNSFLDGHVQYLSSDKEAAGTDWATSAYMHTQIVSESRYMWDYNDTFFGATPPE